MKLVLKILPWFCLAFFGSALPPAMLPKADGDYHVREFGRLPVLLNGRIQPFDTLARNSLLQIRSTGDVPLEEVPSWQFWHHAKKLKATEWLLEVMTRPEVADTRPIFLIHYSDLLSELKLQDKGVEKSGLRYYTFNQLRPVLDEISTQGQKASEVEPAKQTTFQKQVAKLANAVILYQRLGVTLQPPGAQDFPAELAAFSQNLPAAQAAAQKGESDKNFDKDAIERMAQPLRDFQLMARFGYPLVVPPPTAGSEGWQNAGNALLDSVKTGSVHPVALQLANIAAAYGRHQPEAFNGAVAGYRDWLQAHGFTRELLKGRAEFYYNQVKAFLYAIIFYIAAFVLAGIGILTFALAPNLSESLRRSAFYLILLAGVVHTFGLVYRMILEGRPPVTNLYSSAIFIGWATMVFGVIIERVYRVGLGSLVSSFAGFVTLLIAHNLALGSGDTMEMLRAVLDTNFWLATHVVVITLGYAATFFAGLLAIFYIFLGVFTPLLTQKIVPVTSTTTPPPLPGSRASLDLGKVLGKMVYAVVCFATLFSFVGTVLGGIWADQSWGRFWGWDPKENGALLIVLWNAIILHARWGGLVRDRGLMNLAVFGNIVTSFSWFGVNMLGIGLHSYGFMDAAFKWLMGFTGGFVAIIGLGLLPLSMWRSFRTAAPKASPPSGGPPVPRPAAA